MAIMGMHQNHPWRAQDVEFIHMDSMKNMYDET